MFSMMHSSQEVVLSAAIMHNFHESRACALKHLDPAKRVLNVTPNGGTSVIATMGVHQSGSLYRLAHTLMVLCKWQGLMQ